jgi:hypothetical protein
MMNDEDENHAEGMIQRGQTEIVIRMLDSKPKQSIDKKALLVIAPERT